MIKRNLFLGLVTTAALLFAAPVAASEVSTPIRSTQQDVEQIRGMRLASKARFEGDLSIAPAPVPIAAEPAPAPVLAPASTPVEPAPARVAHEPVQAPVSAPIAAEPAPAPVLAPASTPVELVQAPVVPEPVLVPALVVKVHESEPAPVPIAAEPAPAPVLAPASTPVEPIQAPAPAPKSIPDTVTSPVVATTDLLEILNAPQRAVWMLATDEAWRRVDTAQDYALGADLERGMPTLAAMRKHAPHLLPRALAILRAEQTYT